MKELILDVHRLSRLGVLVNFHQGWCHVDIGSELSFVIAVKSIEGLESFEAFS